MRSLHRDDKEGGARLEMTVKTQKNRAEGKPGAA
jgi:hypothetical protein